MSTLRWKVATALFLGGAALVTALPLRPTAPAERAGAASRAASGPLLSFFGSSAPRAPSKAEGPIGQLRRAGSPAAACEALAALARVRDDEALRAILEALDGEKSRATFRCAAEALGAFARDRSALARLLELGSHRDPQARAFALAALAKSDAPEAKDALLAAARGDDPERALEALCALAAARAPEATALLLAAVETARGERLGRLIEALGKGGDRAAAPALVRLSGRASVETRRAAFAALGELGGEVATGRLVEVLSGPSSSLSDVRLAAEALSRVGGFVARDALLEAAASPTDEVAAAALAGLAPFEGDEVRDVVIENLASPSPSRRQAALDYVKNHRDESAVARVVEAAGTGRGSRAHVVAALLEIGRPEAFAALRELASKAGPLRYDALRALDRVPGLTREELRAIYVDAARRESNDLADVAMQKLALDDGDEARDVLIELVRGDGARAGQAAAALGRRRDPESQRALLEAASRGKARRQALASLAEAGAPGAEGAVAKAYREAEGMLRDEPLALLMGLGGAEAERAVDELLKSGKRDDRRTLLSALESVRSSEASDKLVSDLWRKLGSDDDIEVASKALAHQLEQRPAEAAALLERRMRDEGPEGRRTLIYALQWRAGDEGDGVIHPMLLGALRDRDSSVVAAAVETLGQEGGAQTQAAIADVLTRPGVSDEARRAAAVALEEMGGEVARRYAGLIERAKADDDD
ncbi:MAG TPA: HEAT repeat domain-containing protein [Polyangiaceae bacterium]|nr:HEAT repeat domain-containing protein [Polyangiaceae bacterium]